MTKSGFDIDELEQLLAAATPGEWALYGDCEISAGNLVAMIECMFSETEATDKSNASLIVAARNSLPAMLTEIRELRAENARLKEALDEDGLAEIITDTLDIDWQPRWAAQAIRRAALGEPQ